MDKKRLETKYRGFFYIFVKPVSTLACRVSHAGWSQVGLNTAIRVMKTFYETTCKKGTTVFKLNWWNQIFKKKMKKVPSLSSTKLIGRNNMDNSGEISRFLFNLLARNVFS